MASRRPPQTAAEAADFISQMKRETKSRRARIRMAEMVLSGIGNHTPEAISIWAAYLAEEVA